MECVHDSLLVISIKRRVIYSGGRNRDGGGGSPVLMQTSVKVYFKFNRFKIGLYCLIRLHTLIKK